MRCKTCGGRGTVTSPTNQGHDTTEREYLEGLAEVECPELHVAVKQPAPVRLGSNDPAYVTVYHDPATVLPWCEAHGHHGNDGGPWECCRIVAYPMPTETLGEVVA